MRLGQRTRPSVPARRSQRRSGCPSQRLPPSHLRSDAVPPPCPREQARRRAGSHAAGASSRHAAPHSGQTMQPSFSSGAPRNEYAQTGQNQLPQARCARARAPEQHGHYPVRVGVQRQCPLRTQRQIELNASQPRDQLLPTLAAGTRRGAAVPWLRRRCCAGVRERIPRIRADGETDSRALLEISGGNPLHLHHVVRQAPEAGSDRPEWVRSMPRCGTRIREYHQRLWDQLAEPGKALSVVLGELASPFPADELVWLMGRAGHSAADRTEATRRADHLTRRAAGNVQLCHTSFQAFLGDPPDAAVLKRAALAAIRDWPSGPGSGAGTRQSARRDPRVIPHRFNRCERVRHGAGTREWARVEPNFPGFSRGFWGLCPRRRKIRRTSA